MVISNTTHPISKDLGTVFKKTSVFPSDLHSSEAVEAIETGNQIFCREIFDLNTFFTSMRYRSLNFSLFWTINLVLLVTFEQMKLEMPDWSHFEEF